MRILIAEDDRVTRVSLERQLRRWGLDVVSAEDGAIAWQEFQRRPFDIVLTDWDMPNMDGRELVEKIHASDRGDDTYLIMLTARSATEDLVFGMEAGADDFVSKPFDRNELRMRLKAGERRVRLERDLAARNVDLREANETIRVEQEKTERLLLNILPERVAEDLKQTGRTPPELFQDVSVLFADIVGFTKLSEELSPEVLIAELNALVTEFDRIADENACMRIKTIGDAYLSVCGMPQADPAHATNVVRSAVQMLECVRKRNTGAAHPLAVRIGIHSGPVIGAVVGTRKFIYDVFGDTINTASRIENHSESMRINVSEATYLQGRAAFRFLERAPIEVKGKGPMRMYFVDETGSPA